MSQITFGYSDSEDRVWLASTGGTRFWLTRRLVNGLLRPTCDLLEKTVPGGDVPNALPASQRIAIEHEESLADSPEGLPAIEKNKETRGAGNAPVKPPALVTIVTVQADASRCAWIVTAAAKPARIEVNRLEFHRLLAALYRTAEAAGWGLANLPGWLTGRPRPD
ncbi:hypothetical protein EZJ19_08165 [Parasulfuritortus cantonensis]|uniref:Uncharacterized protein n=1 Tax=Parasulfuritortus cantonensis TaxID=2528202 RepID=A0A4R1BDG7_9PROT|nr:hypothetical protein [Parasulfuritortus cantonensis]TCJ15028.1 hypothetical protein EZJ19_08165 [Parasulfuritortus cantonensis]